MMIMVMSVFIAHDSIDLNVRCAEGDNNKKIIKMGGGEIEPDHNN